MYLFKTNYMGTVLYKGVSLECGLAATDGFYSANKEMAGITVYRDDKVYAEIGRINQYQSAFSFNLITASKVKDGTL